LDKLLVKCGFFGSATEAARKIKEGAVRIDANVEKSTHLYVQSLPARWPIRVGKRVKVVVIYE
jgi:tyrosyl-tRNA synthetase